jgi:hypothetical protein
MAVCDYREAIPCEAAPQAQMKTLAQKSLNWNGMDMVGANQSPARRHDHEG